jgi:hypothetical protein
MRPEGNWRRLQVFTALVLSTTISACATAPVTLNVTPTGASAPLQYGTKDYPHALAAIMAVMVNEWQLPGVDVSVTLYPSQVSYESGVISELDRNRQRIRQQLNLALNPAREEQALAASKRLAVNSAAVGMYRRVLINEPRVNRLLWTEWVRVLGHELAHTAQIELANDRPAAWDQWLVEGFAEWVGYKIADRLGAESFAKSRAQALNRIARVKGYQTLPSLTQLVDGPSWTAWVQSLGDAATYGQAFIAVDFLVEQKGMAAVIDYFRLYRKLNNRTRNFTAAFGESLDPFDKRFSVSLARQLGG